jgi:hypothetical protein
MKRIDSNLNKDLLIKSNLKLKLTPLLKMMDRVKVKSRVVRNVFNISGRILNLSNSTFAPHWRRLLVLTMGRSTGLRNRCIIISNFISFLIEFKSNHGQQLTVKYLKACYVALQKALAGDKLKSLRSLEPDIPLPRLINGFPAMIGSKDRALIRQGHVRIIVFWSSLFSLYRVLKTPYTLKLGSITDKFAGNEEFLASLIRDHYSFNPFTYLPGYLGFLDISI